MVHATQGSTVNSEVLGNGDATLANQAFTLKRPPLTYVNDNRYSVQNSDGTIQKGGCTLQVFVSSNSGVPAPAAPILNPFTTAQQTPVGDLWTQVPTLFGTSPEDKVYTLATDSNGSSTVTFGDGVEGARLPTGYGNVAARYRTGLGPGGNLPANSLTVFRNRPAGVRAVTNPVPATGGIYAEAIDSMTSRMTFAARSIGRIVSLKDYQSFSLTQDDVIKARADLVKNGPVDTAQSEQVVWLTVGVRGDRAIAPDQATFLAIAIEAARVGRSTFQVAGFETVYFELSALITSDGTVETGVLKANVRAALVEAFSFDMRLFYQPVTAAEVVATMQGVAGVYEATLDLLYFTGDKPSRANSLPAREPRWSVAKNAILEAQLLIIDSATANDGVAIIATERPL
jgi:predicted phage baseplate assembly protein